MIDKMRAEDLDTAALLSFKDDDFKDLGELGITLGKRKKIKTSACCARDACDSRPVWHCSPPRNPNPACSPDCSRAVA